MKVLSVVGNRPQFVKSAPLSVALREHGIDEIVLHTGQHYDPELSQVFFDELELPEPRYRLDLHTADTAPMRAGIRDAIGTEGPDVVLVFGDTNSTLAGALRGQRHRSPAGSRRGGAPQRRPDDARGTEPHRGRPAAPRFSSAPDEHAAETLATEGVPGRREVVGDVMLDATLQLAPIAAQRSHVLDALDLEPRAYVVTTVHREANAVPERLGRILEGLRRLDEQVVFPVHPRTRKALEDASLEAPPNVRLLRPLRLPRLHGARVTGPRDRHRLRRAAEGGVLARGAVRDAARHHRVGRHGRGEGERPGGRRSGRDRSSRRERPMPDERPQLYGDGHASERIAEVLASLPP